MSIYNILHLFFTYFAQTIACLYPHLSVSGSTMYAFKLCFSQRFESRIGKLLDIQYT